MVERQKQSHLFSVGSAKGNLASKDILLSLVVTVAVLISRLPFIGAGYGSDADGWLIAATARSIAYSRQYMASRLPGFPVQEIICALIWKGGPLALNGITALLSAVATAFFVLCLRSLGCKDPILPGLALAFTPSFYIASTSSMDYPWALSFILGSLYFILSRRLFLGGIFLGIAMGCRITSGAMLLPFSMLLFRKEAPKTSLQQILTFSLTTCGAGLLTFAPALLVYGKDMFSVMHEPFPSFVAILKRATTDVWGVLGLMALAIAGMSISLWCPHRRNFEATVHDPSLSVVSITAIGIYLVAFLTHPDEGGYLIPVIPFVIFLLWKLLNQTMFIVACVALIVSPFLATLSRERARPEINSSCSVEFRLFHREFTLDLLKGPILFDHSARIHDLETMKQILSAANDVHERSVIVTGWNWAAKIRGNLVSEEQEGLVHEIFSPEHVRLYRPFVLGKMEYVHLVDLNQLTTYLRQGMRVFYLPGARQSNLRQFGFDLKEHGAMPFMKEEENE